MPYKWLGLPLALGILLFVVVYAIITPNTEPRPVPTTSLEDTTKPSPPPPELTTKVGQLFIIGHWATTPVASTTALIRNYQPGGVIIMSAPENPTEILSWTNEWQAVADHKLMIAIDQEGGVVSRLKGSDFIQTAQPDITTPEEAFAVATTRGKELSSLGINTNFAPVVETSVSPTSFLYERVFRDPQRIWLLSRATLQGYLNSGVSGVIKHYPGHEDEPTDSHTELPIVELSGTTFNKHTENFNDLIALSNTLGNNLVEVVMTAHVLVPSIDPIYPATLSEKILTGELREKQNYDGLIITDDMTMDAIDNQFTIASATIQALNAGADLILFAAEPNTIRTIMPAVQEAVTNGQLATSTIAEHVARLERWREKQR